MLRASQGHEDRRNACWLFIKSRPKTGNTVCCFNRTKKTYPRHGIQDSCLNQICSLIWERRGRSSLLAEAIFDNTATRLNRGKRKLAGRLRTSHTVCTPCLDSVERNSSNSRFEWPMVKTVRVAACEEVMEGSPERPRIFCPKMQAAARTPPE